MKNKIIVIIFWFFLIGIFFLPTLNSASDTLMDLPTEIITVKNGQTLWGIASEINDGTYNIHLIISTIEEMNNLDSVLVRPGQSLTIPVLKCTANS